MISNINDFMFCPASIYYHNLMYDADRMMTQSRSQINGTHAHKTIEEKRYSSKKSVLHGISVYCEKYGTVGRIDLFDTDKGILTERKKHQSVVYKGLIFQVYAQCFSLEEMGYDVREIRIYSMDDNRVFPITHPRDDPKTVAEFERTLENMRNFDLFSFVQENPAKCERCIYEPMCGSTEV